MKWKNFQVWQGRLPHWRADEVNYYATFRHRRALNHSERQTMLKALLRPQGRRWEIRILCVLPLTTELIVCVRDAPSGVAYELSDILESAKAKAGRAIAKAADERYPPTYPESYDRIIRDEVELEQRWVEIFESPVTHEVAESSEDFDTLWVNEALR